MGDFTGKLAPGETNFIASKPLTQAEADELYFPLDGDIGGSVGSGGYWGLTEEQVNAAIQEAINPYLTVQEADLRYLRTENDFNELINQLTTQYNNWLTSNQSSIVGLVETTVQETIDAAVSGVVQESLNIHRTEIPAHNWGQISEKPDFNALYRLNGVSIGWNELSGIPSIFASDWSLVTNKPTTFTPSTHTHPWADITSPPIFTTRWPTYSEVTDKPNFDLLYRPLTGKIEWTDILNVPPQNPGDWNTLLNKPTTFTPSAHTHPWTDLTEISVFASRWPGWDEVANKPSAFIPTNHASTHATGQPDAITPASIGAVATSRIVSTGTGLTGGGNLSSNRTIALANTSVVSGNYGSSSEVPSVTIDAQGRITSASNNPITFPLHASSHHLGGTDALSAEAIGAEVAGAAIGAVNAHTLNWHTLNWQPVTLINGWQGWPGYEPVQFALVGGLLYFTGVADARNATSRIIGTSPVQFTYQRVLPALGRLKNDTQVPGLFLINPNNTLELNLLTHPVEDYSWFSLHGTSIPIAF